jgi:hypothetical protein
MDDVTRLNRSRCLQIGGELINGPRALFPPTHGGPPDWLEPQLLITLRYPNYERIESVIVYCDDTMNKEDGFLPPMLRHAVWRRPNDLSGAHAWPSITVRLGSIKNQPAVDACLQMLQQNVQQISFPPPIGLSLNRDVADVIGVPTLPAYTISLRNGVQGFEYSSCSIENDSFSIQINDSFSVLIAELNEIDPRGWLERYDRNLKTEFPAICWEWNYDEQPD